MKETQYSRNLPNKANKLFRFLAIFSAGIVFLSCGALQAQLIDVQFATNSLATAGNGPDNAPAMSGAAVLGSAGDQWNQILVTSGSGISLINADGSASAVTMSFTSGGAFDDNGTYGNSSTFTNSPCFDLMQAYLYNNGIAQTVTLAGLAANSFYNLALYNAANAGSGLRPTYFTVNTNVLASTWDGVTTNLVSGVDYVEFTSALSDGSGNLVITYTGNGSAEGDINGFQIQAVQQIQTEPFTINAAYDGTNINISFMTQSGFSYQVQYVNNLTNTSWISLGGSISGNDAVQSVSDLAGQNSRFYRVQLSVNIQTPVISSAPTASAITYGQTLANSTLSGGVATNAAGATVAGAFAFTTPSTAPGLGTAGESVTFTPNNSTDYNSATGNVNVTVNQQTPTLTAPTASAITYGQTLTNSTLSGGAATNAANNTAVAGVFGFTTPSTAPGAGTPGESVTFTPTDTTDYNSAIVNVNVPVNQQTPTLTAPTASAITYGQTLASSSLSGGGATNAVNNAPVAGTFAFTTPSTVPGVGTNSESVTFTPTDTTDYTTATVNVNVTVNQQTATTLSLLQTSGINIVNASGATVQLTGLDLGGWLVMEPWMCPCGSLPDNYSVITNLDSRFSVATEQSLIETYQTSWITTNDLNNITNAGFNCVRVPVWWGDFYSITNTTSSGWRSDAFNQLDWLVANCASRGIYVVIDMHGVVGGQSTDQDTGQENQNRYWSSGTDQSETAYMWTQIAAHYNGNSTVAGYDLINEPDGVSSTSTVWPIYNSLYQTVRAADPNHMIILEGTFGNWDWSMLPNPSMYGWTNVVYSMHEYQNGGNTQQVLTGSTNQVTDFNNHKSWNVPDYIGEWNDMGNGAACYDQSIYLYNGDGISWNLWTYKAGAGPIPNGWGWYDPTGNPPNPNISTATESTIMHDWLQWNTTTSFGVNSTVGL
jgi:aryl-phospho-beta-D-glucosidase BglC (GH1 family)